MGFYRPFSCIEAWYRSVYRWILVPGFMLILRKKYYILCFLRYFSSPNSLYKLREVWYGVFIYYLTPGLNGFARGKNRGTNLES